MSILVWALAALMLGAAFLYNRLVRRRHAVRRAWAQVDVQLVRRHALLPRLVDVLKGYMAHERVTLQRVTALRGEAVRVGQGAARMAAEAHLCDAVLPLVARVESYPALRSDLGVTLLLEEIVGAENRIAFARQHYNEAAKRLNDSVHEIPSGWLARLAGMGPAAYFER